MSDSAWQALGFLKGAGASDCIATGLVDDAVETVRSELTRLHENNTRLGLLRVEAEADVERMQTVIREYVKHIESGEHFGALVDLVPGLVDDTGTYGAVGEES